MTRRAGLVLSLSCVLVSAALVLLLAGCGEKTPPASTKPVSTPTPPAATKPTTASAPAGPPTAAGTGPAPSAALPAPPKAQPVASEPTAPAPFLAQGQVLAWKRGGITSSLCDQLAIYGDGHAVATSCKGQGEVERGRLMLNETQRNQLNEWLRTLKRLDEQDEGTAATGVPGRLAVAGFGDQDASPSDLSALRGFAASLFEQAVRAGIPIPQTPQTGSTTGDGS